MGGIRAQCLRSASPTFCHRRQATQPGAGHQGTHTSLPSGWTAVGPPLGRTGDPEALGGALRCEAWRKWAQTKPPNGRHATLRGALRDQLQFVLERNFLECVGQLCLIKWDSARLVSCSPGIYLGYVCIGLPDVKTHPGAYRFWCLIITYGCQEERPRFFLSSPPQCCQGGPAWG